MQRFSVIGVAILVALLGTGCAAPKQFVFDPVATYDADYDAVWTAVIEYFATANLPIQTIEKDSGLIVTEWMDASENSISAKENKLYCDCGGAGLTVRRWTSGKFSIHVKRLPGGNADLRVTCTFQQGREIMDTVTVTDCPSTGYLEKMIHDYVRVKVSGGQPPDVPTFPPPKNV